MSERITVIHDDCRNAVRNLPDNSIDSCVTDPPYALVSIQKRFGKPGSAPAKEGKDGLYRRASAGFMGKQWDTGETAFDPEFWREVLRVLKPGAHLVAFSGTRTYHRMACAIEDAGFEIRDMTAWLYGSGFPKSHNVSKAIDKHLGVDREKVRETNIRNPKATGGGKDGTVGATRPWIEAALERGYHEKDGPIPATAAAAAAWDGWGTALKPALEPVCLARKPVTGTIAANVLEHGTGALNIDGCRVETDDKIAPRGSMDGDTNVHEGWARPWMADKEKSAARMQNSIVKAQSLGRWPANVVHDGSDEVLAAFPSVDTSRSTITSKPGKIYGNGAGLPSHTGTYGADESGSAARFFYSAKADADDRMGSKHPTVKPVELMRWLVRLITPPNGLVLDPFAGTGSTGIAAIAEGMQAVLIEREADYIADIHSRINYVRGRGPLSDQLKQRNKPEPKDPLPLFIGDAA